MSKSHGTFTQHEVKKVVLLVLSKDTLLGKLRKKIYLKNTLRIYVTKSKSNLYISY